MPALFQDRADAGRALARKLLRFKDRSDLLVLALPRGGVPVAHEVALALHATLDIFVVRKLGVPGHEELAFGAIATGGIRVLNQGIINELNLPNEQIEIVVRREQEELTRREAAYRGNRPALDFSGKTVILVDDGLATGASMMAAARALRQKSPARIVVAVPVAAPAVCDEFRLEVDEVVCATTPRPFYAVGVWYENFNQTTDNEVRRLLEQSARQHVS
jgi:putative phosphoribosyl transferase